MQCIGFFLPFFWVCIPFPGDSILSTGRRTMENNGLCTVGMLCEKTGITRKTLFYYDRIGLLKPTVRSGIQEHKLYDEAACMRLSGILRFRRAGLRIDEIRRILDDPDSNVPMILQNAVERCYAQQNILLEQVALLKELMEEYPS